MKLLTERKITAVVKVKRKYAFSTEYISTRHGRKKQKGANNEMNKAVSGPSVAASEPA